MPDVHVHVRVCAIPKTQRAMNVNGLYGYVKLFQYCLFTPPPPPSTDDDDDDALFWELHSNLFCTGMDQESTTAGEYNNILSNNVFCMIQLYRLTA